MSQPIRVLHVLGTLNMGGAESRVMDLYRHMDRSRVQFDFLVHYRMSETPTQEQPLPGHGEPASSWSDDLKGNTEESPQESLRESFQESLPWEEQLRRLRPKGYFDDEVYALGGRIYILPRFTGRNLGEYKRAAEEFFARHHDYAAVEGHMTSTASIYLPIAKKAGIPVTIAHARSAGMDPGLRGLATRILRKNLAKKCDVCLSCSNAASVAVFGRKAVEENKVRIIPNALDVRSFRYSPEKRKQVRDAYGIPSDAFVIGHVGRFDPVKNQAFLAQILHQITILAPAKKEKFICLFAGEGKCLEQVRQAFDEVGMAGQAVFAGQCDRNKTVAMYQAFDAFCFPSLYEGLPGTVIEAQASGLPCLISDTITDEVCVTDLVRQYDIHDAGSWARALLDLKNAQEEPNLATLQNGTEYAEQTEHRRHTGRSHQEFSMIANRTNRSGQAINDLDAAGFDIVTAAVRMQEFYLRCAEGVHD